MQNADAGTVLLLTLKGDKRNLCGEGKMMTQGSDGGELEQMAKASITAFVSSTLPSPLAPKSMTFTVVDATATLNSSVTQENARKNIKS
jgi:hypothetical protein